MLVRVSPFQGLNELQEDALSRVDKAALRVLGEDLFRSEHEAARVQADLFLRGGSEKPGAAEDLLAPEVTMGRAADLREAAEIILTQAGAAKDRMVQVRKVRLRIKQAIRQAHDRDEVVSLRDAGVLELQCLKNAATSTGRTGCE